VAHLWQFDCNAPFISELTYWYLIISFKQKHLLLSAEDTAQRILSHCLMFQLWRFTSVMKLTRLSWRFQNSSLSLVVKSSSRLISN